MKMFDRNRKHGVKNYEVGFTLIELLASIIVLVAIGSVIAGIISSSLRGASKTNSIETIRQNGNYAISQISKDIEYAPPFDGVKTGMSISGDSTYSSGCPYSTPTPPALPSPVVTTYKSISVQSGSNIVVYNCSPSGLTATNGSPLLDSSISVSSCTLTCTQTNSTDVPIIGISFTLAANNNSVPFQTSVLLRNYNK